MNITVYLGALKGNNESLEKAVRQLGTFIQNRSLGCFGIL